jgi:hypothetical protein
MTAAIITMLILVAATAFYILRPLLAADARDPERGPTTAAEARDLQGEHDMVLASLKDLEDDRATGKLTDEDYTSIHARLSARAVKVMKQLDSLAEQERAATAPLRHPAAQPPDTA